jgi:hypothetical protein
MVIVGTEEEIWQNPIAQLDSTVETTHRMYRLFVN